MGVNGCNIGFMLRSDTLKLHFRDLAERNHLEQHGSGRGVWYGLK